MKIFEWKMCENNWINWKYVRNNWKIFDWKREII